MKAARVHRFGPPSAITLEDIPIPVAGPGEVLVRVHAAGVGPWDGWVRAGKSVLPQPLPLTLGSDLSGVIVAVGRGVAEFAPGDEIFGVTNPRFTGAYAEYAIAGAGMIAKRPASLTHVDAASVPVVAVTAWQALFEEAHLEQGAKVLIHGAAGNVGARGHMKLNRIGSTVFALAAIAGVAAMIGFAEPFHAELTTQTAEAGRECIFAGESGCGRANEIQLADARGPHRLDKEEFAQDNAEATEFFWP